MAMHINNDGFSLVELLVVIAVLGILTMIAVPSYLGQQKRAARTEAFSNLENLRLLEEQYFADRGSYVPNKGNAGANHPENIALIQNNTNQDGLPNFKPGDASSLNYSYEIRQDANITSQGANSTATPCFLAIATGNTNGRGAGDSFMVDCNNQRNF